MKTLCLNEKQLTRRSRSFCERIAQKYINFGEYGFAGVSLTFLLGQRNLPGERKEKRPGSVLFFYSSRVYWQDNRRWKQFLIQEFRGSIGRLLQERQTEKIERQMRQSFREVLRKESREFFAQQILKTLEEHYRINGQTGFLQSEEAVRAVKTYLRNRERFVAASEKEEKETQLRIYTETLLNTMEHIRLTLRSEALENRSLSEKRNVSESRSLSEKRSVSESRSLSEEKAVSESRNFREYRELTEEERSSLLEEVETQFLRNEKAIERGSFWHLLQREEKETGVSRTDISKTNISQGRISMRNISTGNIFMRSISEGSVRRIFRQKRRERLQEQIRSVLEERYRITGHPTGFLQTEEAVQAVQLCLRNREQLMTASEKEEKETQLRVYTERFLNTMEHIRLTYLDTSERSLSEKRNVSESRSLSEKRSVSESRSLSEEKAVSESRAFREYRELTEEERSSLLQEVETQFLRNEKAIERGSFWHLLQREEKETGVSRTDISKTNISQGRISMRNISTGNIFMRSISEGSVRRIFRQKRRERLQEQIRSVLEERYRITGHPTGFLQTEEVAQAVKLYLRNREQLMTASEKEEKETQLRVYTERLLNTMEYIRLTYLDTSERSLSEKRSVSESRSLSEEKTVSESRAFREYRELTEEERSSLLAEVETQLLRNEKAIESGSFWRLQRKEEETSVRRIFRQKHRERLREQLRSVSGERYRFTTGQTGILQTEETELSVSKPAGGSYYEVFGRLDLKKPARPAGQVSAEVQRQQTETVLLRKETVSVKREVEEQDSRIHSLQEELRRQKRELQDLAGRWERKAPAEPVDVGRMTERVMRELQKQFRLEKARRGM